MAIRDSSPESMTPAEAFSQAVARRADSVLSQGHTRREIFAIGGLPFELSCPGGPDRWLGNAFMVGPIQAAPDAHRLTVWDGISPAALPPEPPWASADYTPLGVVQGYSNDAVRCAFDVETNALIVQNLVENTSHVWFPSIAQLPAWATAAPFRVPLSWLCNRQGMQMVHGAGVTIDGKAALLAGKGGAGKSTTALACALAGMGYLGDDYCAVAPKDRTIHMVYRSAKVFPPAVEMLPALEPWIASQGKLPLEKDIVFLDAADVNLVGSAPLSAILLPRIGTSRASTIAPATPAEATKAILPTTFMQLMGGTPVTAALIMQLTRDVPAFHLELGTDLNIVTDTITRLLRSM
jgi:hypothetical protein